MEIIKQRAFARAGLIGNPSDGYNGKTISVIVKNFLAQVTLYEWDRIEIVPSPNDESAFDSIHDLAKDVRLHGYYGGIRLVKAAICGFADYCSHRHLSLHERKFSIRYETNIPRQVGLAGSSAIVVATLRALMEFYNITIPKTILPSFVLSIEKDRLGIMAGLQDRVAQVYEGCVFMDFSPELMRTEDGFVCGKYEPLAIELLPPLYLSYSADFGEPTEVFHNNLRFRYDNGEKNVVAAMNRFAALASQLRDALLNGHPEQVGDLMNQNFDLRRTICQLPSEHIQMIETARNCGASAKFAGSGGAIIGTYSNESMYETLQAEMKKIGCKTIKPIIV
ncbi:MAG: mevalonate kinase family protein [Thermoguttaceae bacterium]